MENLDKDKIERIIKTRKQAHSWYLGKSKLSEKLSAVDQDPVNLAFSASSSASLASLRGKW